MEIRLLRSFVTLASQGHFGRAAGALCITQPTLTKQIQSLESDLGARLFERGRQGAQLTAFGELFLPDAQRLIEHTDELVQNVARAVGGERGRLRIGFGLSALDFAPQAIAGFRALYPQVEISLDDYSSREQARRLLAGELDVGFLRLPVDSVLHVLPLFAERLALAVPAASHWQRAPDDLDDLNTAGFVALSAPRGPGLAAQIAQWCMAHRFSPRVTQYCADIQTVLAIVSAGLGVALLPCRAALLLPQRVRMLPIEKKAASWQIGLAWHAERDDPVVKRFVEFASRPTDEY